MLNRCLYRHFWRGGGWSGTVHNDEGNDNCLALLGHLCIALSHGQYLLYWNFCRAIHASESTYVLRILASLKIQ